MRDRLRAIHGGLRPTPPPVRRLAGIEGVIPGLEIETPAGATYVVERRYPLDHWHGAPVGGLHGLSGASLATLTGDARLTDFDPTRAVVLDTETTGLAGGTGTYTFLVGLGLVEGNDFVVRQVFLRGLQEEPAQLAWLAEVLAGRGGLVTFNGRSFDWPLLVTRFTLARRSAALPTLAHWDVLPLARRLWRPRLGSCALGALEERVLGQPRTDDTPGWLIPQLYFDYLRDGDARRLGGVFEHNARDILALAALAGLIGRALGAEPDGVEFAAAQDLAALATHAAAIDQPNRAISLFRRALHAGLPPAEQETATRQLSLLLKRAGRWAEAVELWQTMLTRPLADAWFPTLELAKYYEHQARDFARASDLVDRLHVVNALRGGQVPADVERRLSRLRRKARTVPLG